MKILRFFVCIVFLVSSVLPFTARAQSSENIVLLPLQVPPSLQSKRDVFAAAIQNALREKFNVFYGPQVEEALRREMAKSDCSAESCVQNIAVEFNGEIVVDATIDQLGSSYVLSIKFNNVITGELEESILSTCDDCTENALFKFVQQQALLVDLDAERGLTALLEKSEQSSKSAKEQGKLDNLASTYEKSKDPEPQPDPQKEEIIAVPQQPAKRKASTDFTKEKEGLSWWVYGLPLLALGGGGGGGGGGDAPASSPTIPTPSPTPDPTPDLTPDPLLQIEGDVVKGPLRSATVFLDYNDNGALDTGEPFTLTDNNGSYSFQVENANAAIVVVTDENTVDTSSGEVMSGLVLKAPQGSTVVTPVTTLFADGDMTEAEVKASLGIAAEVDIKSFNPFKAEAGSQVAVKLEKLALQIVSSANAIAKVAQDEGVDQFEASKRAFASIIESIDEKSNNGEQFDFTAQDDIAKVREKAESELSELISFDADKRTALRGAMETAKSTIETIENLTSLDDEASQNIFRSAARIKGDIDNRKSTDSDNDGIPDFIDFDRDNDGVEDLADLFPDDASETADLDGDGVGDNSDRDRDGDGIENDDDAFPADPSEVADLDEDSVGDNADLDRDGDGVDNQQDIFPNDPFETVDLDGDGIGDNSDADRDGDGVANSQDAFPENIAESSDIDGDGVGDNADGDRDGDGVVNAQDVFPNDAAETADLDGDGRGDNGDTDRDGDGIANAQDAFPSDASETADGDGDGVGDNADYWPEDGNKWSNYSKAVAFFTTDTVNKRIHIIEDATKNRFASEINDLPQLSNNEEELNFYINYRSGESALPISASTFDVDSLFEPTDELYNADFSEGVRSFLDKNTHESETLYLMIDAGGGDTQFGALRYHDGGLPDMGRWMAVAIYSGTEAPDSVYSSHAGLIGFAGRSAGHMAGQDDDYHTVSDIGLDVNFDDASFSLVSSNTHSTSADHPQYPSFSRRTDLDFSLSGSINEGIFEADSISIDNAVLDALEIIPYGETLHTFGGGWIIQKYQLGTYLAAFGAEMDDADGDGLADDVDAFPNDPNETADLDNDGIGDNADTDRDGDGVANASDAFPNDANETADLDGDGTGDNADTDRDGDGVANASDAFPRDATETADLDGDGIGDNADADRDGDGVANASDAFPRDATETADLDGDGIGDNADADRDGDGVANASDAFPSDATETADLDGDGIGDNADADRDGDGVANASDAFPRDATETADLDSDGIGDNADTDRDGDGVANASDAFPSDATETADLDGDGIGDNADADRDGDGVANASDAFPSDATETADLDGDGIGDNADAFPSDASEFADADGDGVGDNADAYPNRDSVLLGSNGDGRFWSGKNEFASTGTVDQNFLFIGHNNNVYSADGRSFPTKENIVIQKRTSEADELEYFAVTWEGDNNNNFSHQVQYDLARGHDLTDHLEIVFDSPAVVKFLKFEGMQGSGETGHESITLANDFRNRLSDGMVNGGLPLVYGITVEHEDGNDGHTILRSFYNAQENDLLNRYEIQERRYEFNGHSLGYFGETASQSAPVFSEVLANLDFISGAATVKSYNARIGSYSHKAWPDGSTSGIDTSFPDQFGTASLDFEISFNMGDANERELKYFEGDFSNVTWGTDEMGNQQRPLNSGDWDIELGGRGGRNLGGSFRFTNDSSIWYVGALGAKMLNSDITGAYNYGIGDNFLSLNRHGYEDGQRGHPAYNRTDYSAGSMENAMLCNSGDCAVYRIKNVFTNVNEDKVVDLRTDDLLAGMDPGVEVNSWMTAYSKLEVLGGNTGNDGPREYLVADDIGFDYTSFGIFSHDRGGLKRSTAVYHLSDLTSPTKQWSGVSRGEVDFSGRSIGVYSTFVNVANGNYTNVITNDKWTNSEISVNANFLERSFSLASINTEKSENMTGTYESASDLDFTVSGSISAAGTLFTDTFDFDGSVRQGQLVAHLSGPNGEELGGNWKIAYSADTTIDEFGLIEPRTEIGAEYATQIYLGAFGASED